MGEAVRLTRGLWRDVGLDDRERLHAYATVLPDDAVFGDRTAAYVQRLWVPAATDQIVDVVVPGRAGPPRVRPHSERSELRTRRRGLHPDEVVVVDGLRVTSPARTWCDLAEALSPPDLVALGDSALRAGSSREQLRTVLARARHRRGVRKARAVLDLLDPASESRPESHLRYALVSAGLPQPDVNVAVHSNGVWIGIPDLSYLRARLALEYQGADHAGVARMRRDITRELDFSAAGWQTLEFGPNEVFRRPDFIVNLVRAALQSRDPDWKHTRN